MDYIDDSPNSTSSSSIATTEADSDDSNLTCDRILDEIGGFGRYQILVGFATGVALLLSSFSLLNFIFAAGIPEHRYTFANV